jgi:diguanylate cyclase (GGDEF)-like protein
LAAKAKRSWLERERLTLVRSGIARHLALAFGVIARHFAIAFGGIARHARHFAITFGGIARHFAIAFGGIATHSAITFDGIARHLAIAFGGIATHFAIAFGAIARHLAIAFGGIPRHFAIGFGGIPRRLAIAFGGIATHFAIAFGAIPRRLAIARHFAHAFDRIARHSAITFDGIARHLAIAFGGIARHFAITFGGIPRHFAIAFGGIPRHFAIAFGGIARHFAIAFGGIARHFAIAFGGIPRQFAIAFGGIAVLAIVAAAPAPVLAVAKTSSPAPLRAAFPSADPLLLAMDHLAGAVDASAEGDLLELSARYQKLATELDHAAAEFAAAAAAAGEAPPARFMPTVRSYRQRGDDLLKLAAARRVSMADYSLHFEQLNTRVKKSLDHPSNSAGHVIARQSVAKLTSAQDDLRRRYADFVSADTADSLTFDALGASEGALAQTLAKDRAGFTRAESQGWYVKSVADLQSMSAARKTLLQIDRQRKDGARRFGDDSDALLRIVAQMGKTETYDARLSGSPVAGSVPESTVAASGAAKQHGPSASSPGRDKSREAATGAGAADVRARASSVATAADTHQGASPPAGKADVRGRVPSIAGPDPDARQGASPSSGGTDALGGGSLAAAGWDTQQGESNAAAGSDTYRGVPITAGPDTRRGASPTADASPATGDAAATTNNGVHDRPTTTPESQNHSGRALAAWLSGGVLLIVVCVSAAIALSMVRSVRRLLSATARIANGESGVAVPRGGIREIDALALAFSDMAAQLTAAQEAAHGQQHLLEAKVAERTLQLQELARLDPLTRLPNRRHFFELLNVALENATRENRFVGVFFLDIDNFKNMNDSLGHEFGDQVLQTIAARLYESAHSFGFAARLGGDEFTAAYESASSIEDIRIAGLQLVKAFEEPIMLEGRELIVSVSAGASVYPDHAQSAEALLRAADAALYEAKAIGRSQLALFKPALLEAATARFTTEQGLRRALDRGEFDLVFQPEVNLQTCEIEVVEALLRWRLPEGRYASPGEFLAVAEASGLILQINDWVLRRAVETVAHWHQGSWPAARVAINVSPRQLFDHSFVEQVQALLEQYKLPPGCIEIELTENVLQTGSATIASLHRLRAHGIAIALDDFGTGFSSLASLEQLPLSRIKLDRSLIASIDTSARSVTIARAIIQLCQGLGLSVTAEGIERPAQLAPLVGYSGLHAQGYLLARPQPADQLLAVMATLPVLTRALVRASVARLPDSQLAENLPFVTGAIEP